MKNILRVKINSKSVIKFCQSKSMEDFYCYFPPISQSEHVLKVHFSFHSKTGRTTFKTTSIKNNGQEILPNLLEMVKNHPMYQNAVTPTDLDLYKGKTIVFDKDITFYPWFQIALNLQNSDTINYFGQSKTSDADFRSTFDVKVAPPQNQQITINCFIGKNVTSIPNNKDKDYDLSLTVAESNFLKDKYTFIFCLRYDFPDIKKKRHN